MILLLTLFFLSQCHLLDQNRTNFAFHDLKERVWRFNCERQGHFLQRNWWSVSSSVFEDSMLPSMLLFDTPVDQVSNILYPPTFLTEEDEIFVFGVNYEKTGSASSAVGVLYDFPEKTRLTTVPENQYFGSARGWFKGTEYEHIADYFYCYKYAFKCEKNEKFCFIIPRERGLATALVVVEQSLLFKNVSKTKIIDPMYLIVAGEGDTQTSFHIHNPRFIGSSLYLLAKSVLSYFQ